MAPYLLNILVLNKFFQSFSALGALYLIFILLGRNRASLIIPHASGGYVVSSGNKLERLDWETGKTEVLAELDQEDTHVLNDGKCDVMGRLWAGK